MSSSNEICAKKGLRTSDHERDDMTDYCDTQQIMIWTENSKKSKQKVAMLLFFPF